MLLIKGFIIGIGKIIPGVSGSLLAISMGVYEEAINSFINLKKNYKENILFLGKLGIGILLAIIILSKFITYLLNNYYIYTMFLFIGLMFGPVITKYNEIKYNNKYIYMFISILIIVFLYQFKISDLFNFKGYILDYFVVFFLGFLDSFTMIVPGISGTAIFMMLNCYNFILQLFSNPFQNIIVTIIFGIGVIIGIILTCLLVDFMFKKYKDESNMVILGLTLSSLFILLYPLLNSITLSNVLPLLLLFICGIIISLKLKS